MWLYNIMFYIVLIGTKKDIPPNTPPEVFVYHVFCFNFLQSGKYSNARHSLFGSGA